MRKARFSIDNYLSPRKQWDEEAIWGKNIDNSILLMIHNCESQKSDFSSETIVKMFSDNLTYVCMATNNNKKEKTPQTKCTYLEET